MKVDLKFLVEAIKPDWIPQETWDGMSDNDKQKMSKTEETIETIRNQDKNVSGISPTSDGVQDFLRNIDRQGEEARRTGQTIADVRAREINANPNVGERLPVLTDPVTGRGSNVLVNTSRPPATAAEREQLAAYEQSKARLAAMGPVERAEFDKQLDDKRAKERAAELKQVKAAQDTFAARRLAKLATRSGSVTLADGQTIDIDAIKERAAKDPNTVNDPEIRRQLELLQRQFNKQDSDARRAEREEQAERNRATRLKNAQQTAIQSIIAKDPSKAAEIGAMANYTSGSMTGTSAAYSSNTKPEQAPAQPSTQSGVFGDNKNLPAPVSATGNPLSPRGGMPPAVTSKGTAEGSPSDADTHSGVQISMNTPVAPKLSRSQEDKIVIAGMRNQSLNQPILTQGVAKRAVTGQASSLASNKESSTRQGDARYGARRAGVGGVQAVAETYRFGHKELSSLLESATGSPFGGPSGWDWLTGKYKDVKTAVTTKTTNAGVTTKRTPAIAIRDVLKYLNPLQMKHPMDRSPVLLGQAGYTKGKGIRTVQQLMKNPITDVLATMGGAPNLGQVSGLVGLVKSGVGGALLGSRSRLARSVGSGINLAGNVAQDLLATANTPEAQAQRAILAGSMIGDPRIAQISPAEIIKYKP